MKLLDVIKEIQEEGMTKDKLESYHTKLSTYLSELCIYRATLEKEEAIYFGSFQKELVIDGKVQTLSDVSIRRRWRATELGQKLINIKGDIEAVKPLISSVKSRLYQHL